MRRAIGILVLGVVALSGCSSEGSRSVDTGEGDLLAAGIPGAVAATVPADQDSTPLVARRVWADATPFASPFPDGRYLAHAAGPHLAVRDLRTGESRLLTDKSLWQLEYSSVSPDGELIAYSWWNDAGGIELRVIGVDGSQPRVLYSDESVTWLAPHGWSPDGENILAVFTGEERGREIVLVSAKDGAVRVVKTFDSGVLRELSFAPDGEFIAYDWRPDRGVPGDIFAIDVDGGRETTLVQHPADDVLLGWAPDGGHLLFASDRTGTMGAWLLPVAGGEANGEPRLIKPDMWRVMPLGFTRDGSFFYTVTTSAWDVYMAKLDPETSALVDAPTPATGRFVGGNGGPRWSPDGRYLAWRSQRGDHPRQGVFMIRSLETGETRELDPGFIEISRFPGWSPDGSALLVKAREEGSGSYLFRVDVQTGAAEPLVQVDTYEGRWADWSADGRSIYYSIEYYDGEGGGSPRIVTRDLESGSEVVLYRAPEPALMGPGNVALSPDRRKLALYLAPEDTTKASSLMLVPVVGGTPRELHRFASDAPGPSNLTWTPDGRHLVYTTFWDAAGLWRLPVEGGVPERLGWEGMDKQRDIRFHPDGQRIAFTAGGYAFEIWVMEDFLPGYRAGEETR
ncbi:MAG: PD40 domain-containing protein [Gemmatimonadota bacterium]|nr:MAG: PD40 domain-containing protein [Gemmatimonadota bacterium]